MLDAGHGVLVSLVDSRAVGELGYPGPCRAVGAARVKHGLGHLEADDAVLVALENLGIFAQTQVSIHTHDRAAMITCRESCFKPRQNSH